VSHLKTSTRLGKIYWSKSICTFICLTNRTRKSLVKIRLLQSQRRIGNQDFQKLAAACIPNTLQPHEKRRWIPPDLGACLPVDPALRKLPLPNVASSPVLLLPSEHVLGHIDTSTGIFCKANLAHASATIPSKRKRVCESRPGCVRIIVGLALHFPNFAYTVAKRLPNWQFLASAGTLTTSLCALLYCHVAGAHFTRYTSQSSPVLSGSCSGSSFGSITHELNHHTPNRYCYTPLNFRQIRRGTLAIPPRLEP
jgi:hypothetical protein